VNIYLMVNIYLVSSEINDQKVYKIGITKRAIEKRIKEFKTGNASELLLVNHFNSKWATKIERHLHKYFKNKKISGEWFDLTDEDLKKFKPMCEQLHENFNIIERSNTYYIDRGERF